MIAAYLPAYPHIRTYTLFLDDSNEDKLRPSRRRYTVNIYKFATTRHRWR